jgi:uncharacterized membrane protein YqjE
MTSRTDAPTAQLVEQMSAQVSVLVRDELTLAGRELAEKGKRAGTGAGLLGGSAMLASFGVGTLLLTVGALLALVLPAWLAALIVTAVILAAAGVAALLGKRQIAQAVPPEPEAAMASGRRDVEAVKESIRAGRE